MKPLRIRMLAAVLLLAGCSEDQEATTPTGTTNAGSGAATTPEGGNTAVSGSTGAATPANRPDQSTTSGAAAATAGFETPEAAFQALQTAATNKNYRGFAEALSPRSQSIMAEIMTLPLGFIAAFDEGKAGAVEELMKKHGISMDDESEEFPVDSIPDKVQYLVDVMEWMDKNADSGEGGGPMTTLPGAKLTDLTVTEDTASGTISSADGGDSEPMEFVRIDGRWFVEVPKELELSNAGGIEMSTDSSGFGGFSGSDEPKVPMSAVTMEAFDAAWQTDLNVTDQPAGQVLAQLAEGLKLEFDQTDELEQAISLQITGKSRFEAIEEICRQLKMTPHYEDGRLQIVPGERTTPPVFAGPFLVELGDVEFNSVSATGMVAVRVMTAGLPEGVVQQMNDGSDTNVTITSITDQDGNDIHRERETGSSGFWNSGDKVFNYPMMGGLKNLLRGVTAIGSIDGSIDSVLPVKMALLTFENPKPEDSQASGDVTLTLKSVEDNSYNFDYTGIDDPSAFDVTAYNADGEVMDSFGSSYFGGLDSGSISTQYEESPARIEVRVVTERADLHYDFQFAGVPVPDAEARPESLPELTIDGDAPLTLEFLRIGGEEDFRTAVFRATNHTNKDIEMVSFEMSFQNDAGEELETFPASHEAEPIAAGESPELEVPAFFMPEGTTKVAAKIDQMIFTDATEWAPEE